jgi:hypothetical protein
LVSFSVLVPVVEIEPEIFSVLNLSGQHNGLVVSHTNGYLWTMNFWICNFYSKLLCWFMFIMKYGVREIYLQRRTQEVAFPVHFVLSLQDLFFAS